MSEYVITDCQIGHITISSVWYRYTEEYLRFTDVIVHINIAIAQE